MAQRTAAFYRLVAGEYFPRPPTPALVEREVVEYCGAFTNVCWRSGNTRTRDRSLAEPHRMDRAARIVAGEGKDMTPEDIIRMARETGDVETDRRGRETFSYDSYGLERFAALIAAAEREAISDEYAARLQGDLENGVRWLNEVAASEFNKKYPQLAGFNEWLNERGNK